MSELHLPSSIEAPAPVPPASGKPPAQRGTSATWLFGYDIFISFALGAFCIWLWERKRRAAELY